jgi:hypothetical protein
MSVELAERMFDEALARPGNFSTHRASTLPSDCAEFVP